MEFNSEEHKNLNEETFNEYCEEESHQCFKLQYFCKIHKKLCCGACIAKIKGEEKGKHIDCEVSDIEIMKDEKKKDLENKIKYLEELSDNFNESLDNINEMYERIEEKKENLKLEIQKIFSIIKNVVKDREDEMLSNVDLEYNKIYFDKYSPEDFKKLPDKIKSSLKKCIQLKKDDDINIYNFLKQNDDLENNINMINNFHLKLNSIFDSKKAEIKFMTESNEMNEIMEKIETFGNLKIIYFFSENLKNISSIISNDITYENSIENWVTEEVTEKEIKYELLFKMSENGTNSSDFHKCCDNKGPTLILIKTKNNKIFGGFTPLNWKNKGFWVQDSNNKTFTFSLEPMQKFKNFGESKNGIFCFGDYGPNFGGFYFWIKNDMKKGEAFVNWYRNLFFNDNLKRKKGEGEYKDFETEELEVYKVIY